MVATWICLRDSCGYGECKKRLHVARRWIHPLNDVSDRLLMRYHDCNVHVDVECNGGIYIAMMAAVKHPWKPFHVTIGSEVSHMA